MRRRHKNMLVALALVGFTVYSLWVVVRHGYLGFWTLARHDEWAMQMLVDLTIALALLASWMRRDARARGIDVWPYLLALPLVGSIAALVYMLHREMRR